MPFDAGSMHVASAGTAVQFKVLNRRVKAISFHARSSNTNSVFVGLAGVVSTNGYELSANQSVSWTFGDGSDQMLDFYMNAATTSEVCDFGAVYE